MLLQLCPKYILQVTENLCQCKDSSAEELGPSRPLQELTKTFQTWVYCTSGIQRGSFPGCSQPYFPSIEWFRCVSFSLAALNSHCRDDHGSRAQSLPPRCHHCGAAGARYSNPKPECSLGAARGTRGSCALHVPRSHKWSLSPQMKTKTKTKMFPPPYPLPFQCRLKQNVNVALSINASRDQ